jgi:hypothetical protein
MSNELTFTLQTDQGTLVSTFGPYMPIPVSGTLQEMVNLIADTEASIDAINAAAETAVGASNTATLQAGNAQASATQAQASAAAAAASGTNASTSATASANSATNAANSATTAATSATTVQNIVNQLSGGTLPSAGALTGSEVVPISRGSGLLETTSSALANLVLSGLAPQRQSLPVTSAGQATYTTAGYTVGLINVFVAGIRLSPSQYTAVDGIHIAITDSTVLSELVAGMTVDIDAALSIGSTGVVTTSNIGAMILSWFQALPTSLPLSPGVLWNNGGSLSLS